VERWVNSDSLHGQALRFERSVYSNSYQGRDKHFGRPMKASRAKASKQTGKSATKQAYAPTQSPAPAAAAPESRQPALKLPVQDSSASIAERLQAERKQIFKAISIVECCKNATATLLEGNDSEYMIPAFEAVCDLLDASAMELGHVRSSPAGSRRVVRGLPRPYQGLPKLEYPLHDRIITVTSCGRLCIGRRKINLSRAFAGQDVGIREVAEKIWLVTFMHYDLGFFDHETGRVECAPNPFEAQVLPMSPAPCVRVVVARFYHEPIGKGERQHDTTIFLGIQAEDGRTTHREELSERVGARQGNRCPAAEPVALAAGGA